MLVGTAIRLVTFLEDVKSRRLRRSEYKKSGHCNERESIQVQDENRDDRDAAFCGDASDIILCIDATD